MPVKKSSHHHVGVKNRNEEQIPCQSELIVENSVDAIISKTLDGIITSWNSGAVKMFGYSAKEVVGKSALIIYPPEIRDELPAMMKKVKAGKEIIDHDSVRLHKNGKRIDISFSSSPIKEGGKVIGISCIERDITERKEAERHIKELNEYRGKFIEIISHQLGTPLTAVNWNLEILLNGDFGQLEETQEKFLQATHAASIKIARRIHNLLMAMDVEEGRINYTTNEIDLNNLYAGVINEAQKECKKKTISCRYASAIKKIAPIYGDGEKIHIAILILIENAITYTKNKGKIIFKLGSKDDIVRFEVADTGIGIPQPEQKMVFTRFFRASNASVMQPDAFGLGLFLAKSIIEQHRGKIGFKSKEGKGSAFWFEIPIKYAK